MGSDNNQNILGYNSTDNRYVSDLVTANADGSIIERIEDIKDKVDDIAGIDTKIGENTQFWANSTKTVLGYSNSTYKHIHNPSYVYPNDCSLVAALTSATANTFGNFAELIPANGITVSFDIHWLNIQDVSANGTYILELHEVSNDDLQVSEKYLGSLSVSRQDNFTRSTQIYMQIPVVAANKRIGVRAKKSGAGAGTISFNVMYHDYE